ncbi:MAG: HDOD domain-containing protein [Desulfatiglandales bacterium]
MRKKTEASEKGKNTDKIKAFVLGIFHEFKEGRIPLPHLPRIVQEIQKVAHSPFSSVDDLAKVIERDAVISLKLIALANSAMYQRLEKICSVRRAFPLLGFRETHGIIIAIAYKDLYNVRSIEYRVLMENLWLHCLASAYAAKAIGEKIREDVDKLFLMGLLHDIGKVPILRELSERAMETRAFDLQDVLKMVRTVYPAVSVEILKLWDFPQDFVRMARYQGGPSFDRRTEAPVLVANLASNLASYVGYGDGIDDDHIDIEDLESASLLGLQDDTLEETAREVGEIVRNTAHFF